MTIAAAFPGFQFEVISTTATNERGVAEWILTGMGLRPKDHEYVWLVSFMDYDLGCFDLETNSRAGTGLFLDTQRAYADGLAAELD